MKIGQVLAVASLGVSLATACGSSTTIIGTDSGGGSGSASSSGSSSGGGSGSSSGGGSGSSSGGGSGGSSGSSSGGVDPNTAPTAGNCPPDCGNQTCCLTVLSNGTLQGTCVANAAACTGGKAAECQNAAQDCNTGQVCCVVPGTAGGPSGSACLTSCATGAPMACGDQGDCPNMGAGWDCVQIPGTPLNAVGQCVPLDGGAPEGGTGEGAAPDTGTQDAPAPTDAASGG